MAALSNEMKNFFFWINTTPGAEKITLGSGVKGEHYTIRFWSRRKCFDIHITNEVTGQQNTVFEMRYFTLSRLLINLAKVQENLFYKYWFTSTINLGKLKHHNCILFEQSADKNELSDIIKINGGYMKFRKNIDLTKLLPYYLTPDELLRSDEEIFQVYKVRNGHLKRQGLLFKLKERKNEKQFIFINKLVFKTFKIQLLHATFNLLSQQMFENKDLILKLLYDKINVNIRKQSGLMS